MQNPRFFIRVWILITFASVIVFLLVFSPARLQVDPSTHKIDGPKKKRITFDNRRICYVDGKAFFPIGIYHVSPQTMNWINTRARDKKLNLPELKFDEILDDVKDKGFNTAVYTWGEINVQMLSKYQARGLYAIPECGVFSLQVQKRIFELARTNKNILMWYGVDEPSSNAKIQASNKFYSHAKALGQDIPVGTANCLISDLVEAVHFEDVVMPDYYSIRPDQTFVDLAGWLQTTKSKADATCKPMWAVLQAFAMDRKENPLLKPTKEQLRCQAYIGLVKGATGLIWYAYFTHEELKDSQRGHWFLPDYDLWAYFKTLNSEINTVASKIILPGVQAGSVVCNNENIQMAIWKTKKDRYLIAVNPTPQGVIVTFSEIKADKVCGFFDPSQEISINGGKMTDTFKAYGVNIYKF